MWFKVKKTLYFPHTVHYCCSSMLCLSETHRILQSSSFWEARRALIGQLSGALWLAEYLKRVTEMLRPFPCCDAMSRPFYSLWSRRNETKTIKPAINKTFVAFSEDIMTDYNDFTTVRIIVPSFFHCMYICSVMKISPHRDVDMWGCVWMNRFRWAWQS